MRFDGLNRKLEGISQTSRKGKPVKWLFRYMTNCKELWFEAYANIYSNEGAITEGVNAETLDGFSEERVEQIMNKLKSRTYRFAPVRRTYIPKRNGTKRPLGIPTGDNKLVQEVARILLERVYEPIFSDNSHGFRPKRSCHTALEQIQKVWTGVKWFAEFDIKGFFDNMNHDIMVNLLEKRIDDQQFIRLIQAMLKAGYLEEWKYHSTYSGTPQGGVISPILSNIYLHELDTFMAKLESEFTKGTERKCNREYLTICHQISRLKKQVDKLGKIPDLMNEIKEKDRTRKALPSKDFHDEGYKRLRYCRYADDFIAGVIGTKDDANEIVRKVRTFIEEELGLQVAEEKTGISSGKEGINFLSYQIAVYTADKVVKKKVHGRHTTQRSVVSRIRLGVPEGKAQKFCQKYKYGNWQKTKPLHRAKIESTSDIEIINVYNAELRGLANYYALASNVKEKLKKLGYMANYSLFKTLAYKHKVTLAKAIARLKQGNEYVQRYEVKGATRTVQVYRLKHLKRKPKRWDIDEIPNTLHLILCRSELVKRLNYGECEYCGRTDLPLHSHHVRKLADLKKKKHLQTWEKVMIQRHRKTLVICVECHELLHKGKLSDKRYRKKS